MKETKKCPAKKGESVSFSAVTMGSSLEDWRQIVGWGLYRETYAKYLDDSCSGRLTSNICTSQLTSNSCTRKLTSIFVLENWCQIFVQEDWRQIVALEDWRQYLY